MLIGCISIAGIPPLSGFWSKDAILSIVYDTGAQNPIFYLLWIMGVVTAFLTAFYMFRLWFMTFTGEPRDHHAYEHAHESPWVMAGPLVILSVFAAFSGFAIFFNFNSTVFPQGIPNFTVAAVSVGSTRAMCSRAC